MVGKCFLKILLIKGNMHSIMLVIYGKIIEGRKGKGRLIK